MKRFAIFGLIVLGGLLFGCTSSSNQGSPASAQYSLSSCPNLPNFENHLFSQVIVDPGEYNGSESYLVKYAIQDSYGNGWTPKSTSFFGCNKGTQQGQNVNYLYCEPLHLNKQVVDASGNLGEKTNMKVELAFDLRTAQKTKITNPPAGCTFCAGSADLEWYVFSNTAPVQAKCTCYKNNVFEPATCS